MGMDVYGTEPKNEKGEYFRNNVWWWHPLWSYCQENYPSITASVQNGHDNSGDGLGDEDSIKLGIALKKDIDSGKTLAYEEKRRSYLAGLPLEPCIYCKSTGIRKDAYVDGLCNSCSGSGSVKSFETNYPFSSENLQEFAEFLINCGGFSIC
jgi:hypothetical protein